MYRSEIQIDPSFAHKHGKRRGSLDPTESVHSQLVQRGFSCVQRRRVFVTLSFALVTLGFALVLALVTLGFALEDNSDVMQLGGLAGAVVGGTVLPKTGTTLLPRSSMSNEPRSAGYAVGMRSTM